ncbi:MAG: hypothetical protein ASARMPREDX12_000825 [Alectoria sarmentosa]|nr:MAG: hypothetical protein ASARMPREDX12_000825 [Alectoria sarmentosa]
MAPRIYRASVTGELFTIDPTLLERLLLDRGSPVGGDHARSTGDPFSSDRLLRCIFNASYTSIRLPEAADSDPLLQSIMLSPSFVHVQLFSTLLLQPIRAIPVNNADQSLSIILDSATSLAPPRNDTVTTVLATNTSVAIWPIHPFTIPIAPLDLTWIWFQRIGLPGTPRQKSLLLTIIASQLRIYSAQPAGTSPHPFANTRDDVTFAMQYEERETLDMALALAALRVFQGKVQQWGAQALEFSVGREGELKARFRVVLMEGGGVG